MIRIDFKYILLLPLFFVGGISFAGVDLEPEDSTFVNISIAKRPISPSYRISEKPSIIDTVIPIPNISYPLLSRNMRTEISIDQIDPTKIKIIEKLEKLYPGYLRLGLGNYISPLGEFYYNSMRNRRMSYGVHLNHNSSFGNIKDYAPSTFDNTTARVFGEFFTKQFKIESEINYLNNGYHFYGIRDTTENQNLISRDSLRNRVQGIGYNVRFSNFARKDSATLLYTVKTDFNYFHEFDPHERILNAKNSNFGIGTEMAYQLRNNIYAADLDVRFNKYKFAGEGSDVLIADWHNDNNTIIHLRPSITSYGKKWKVLVGVDLNFDFLSDPIFVAIPHLEGKYSLFNDMFIPYAGIGGGLTQNTFQSLNRTNEFIVSEMDLMNTKELKFYGGIKGTLSKKLSFNLQVHSTTFTNMALFVNDTVWSDMYKFDVVYDKVTATGVNASISYQAAEKLKVDAIVAYNNYTTQTETHAWNLPEIDIKLRGSYNMFDKIYVKSDLTLLGGRKSPEGLFSTDVSDQDFDLGFVADANLSFEYRYNKRVSIFAEFNNLAAQKYFKWNRYRTQGFQFLGGATFSF
ncbi:MAG: hypothetical protein GQ574_15060 [Crocinitomix sp.]|nr:hypothetical protein [Crocinitomix sp.]